MKKIEGELITHHQRDVTFYDGNPFDSSFKKGTKKEWNRFGGTVSKVRSSEGYKINNFRDLIDQVALVTLNNNNYEMYYRGQAGDYLNNQSTYFSTRKQKSMVMPSICRPEKKSDGSYKYSIRTKDIEDRYKKLFAFIEFANKQTRRQIPDETYMALIQHYEIMPTPFIDITQSLRVAATFALKKKPKGLFIRLRSSIPESKHILFYRYGSNFIETSERCVHQGPPPTLSRRISSWELSIFCYKKRA
jgi:hypothetical protein